MNKFRTVLGMLALSAGIVAPSQLTATRPKPCCGEITAAGRRRLTGILDGMNVESLWLAHQHVNWETGEPDRGAEYEGSNKHTRGLVHLEVSVGQNVCTVRHLLGLQRDIVGACGGADLDQAVSVVAPASNMHSHPRRCACGNNPVWWADSDRACL